MEDNAFKWDPAPHTADLAIEIKAGSSVGMFRAALSGFLGILEFSSNPPEETDRITEYHLTLESSDIENALVDFLNECIYITEVEEMIPFGINGISWEGGILDVTLKLRDIGVEESESVGHIKAATYSGLEVKEKDNTFSATIIFDT